MSSVTIVIADTDKGGISIRTDFHPAAGNPCSRAQSAALDMIRRSRKEFGLIDKIDGTTSSAVATVPDRADGVDTDAVHRSRDNVVPHIGV